MFFSCFQKSEESSALSIFDNITERVAETRRLLVCLLFVSLSIKLIVRPFLRLSGSMYLFSCLDGLGPLLFAKAIYPFAAVLYLELHGPFLFPLNQCCGTVNDLSRFRFLLPKSRVGNKKTHPKKPKNPPKKPIKNVFFGFWSFLFLIFYENNTNFSL